MAENTSLPEVEEGFVPTNQKTKEFRNKIAELFIKSIEENAEQKKWHQGWAMTCMPPLNAVTGTPYKGINRFYLTLVMMMCGWEDWRFCTLSQARQKGWKVKRGSKSVQVQYWFPLQIEGKEAKSITWEEYKKLKQQMDAGDKSIRVSLSARYFNVFNGTQLEGIPELPPVGVAHDIKPCRIVDKISENMGVPIIYGGDQAYYNYANDEIHLPKRDAFLSDYDYAATSLHELAHSSGAENRLNRCIKNAFGSEAYALEELTAELTSSFLGIYIGEQTQTRDYSNHTAYLQSWIKIIREDEKHIAFFKAIKDAETAADYLEKAMAEKVSEHLTATKEEKLAS